MSRRSEVSAGILVFRRKPRLELLLAHPGGPYWRNKDDGAWSIPKGNVESGDLLACAKREFNEETGLVAAGQFAALSPLRQKSGKTVHAFALEADFDLVAFQVMRLKWNGRHVQASSKAFLRLTVLPISVFPPPAEKSWPASVPLSRNWSRGLKSKPAVPSANRLRLRQAPRFP